MTFAGRLIRDRRSEVLDFTRVGLHLQDEKQGRSSLRVTYLKMAENLLFAGK